MDFPLSLAFVDTCRYFYYPFHFPFLLYLLTEGSTAAATATIEYFWQEQLTLYTFFRGLACYASSSSFFPQLTSNEQRREFIHRHEEK
jgi:hypothetical protein